MSAYTITSMSQTLLDEIAEAIMNAGPYGSVEIFIQNNIVTQITMRNIRKTAINGNNGSGIKKTETNGIDNFHEKIIGY